MSGAATATTAADSNGAYSFPGLSNGSYTLTPSLTGDSFNPASLNVTISNANGTANFTAVAAPHSITGTINGAGGAPVTLTSGSTTVATIISGASGSVYTFSNAANGSYTVTPTLAGYTFVPASASVTVNGANASIAAFTATAIAPNFTPIRVNAGGPAYTDPSGNIWSADTGFTGGTAASTKTAITNTTTPTLYQTERYGAFSYSFTVPNGSYAVTLKFAEIYFTAAGQRIFNVSINGTTVLSNFDIYSQAGGAFKALDKTFTVTPTSGNITIQFITGSADLPKISAIQILAYSGVGITMTPTTASLSGGQQQQFTPIVTGNSNTAVTWSMNPNVGTLTNGLYTAPATITTTQTVVVTATSVADSTQNAGSTVTLNPPAGPFTPIRVHSGGAVNTDTQGFVWTADTGFSGGSTGSTTAAITGTPDQTLYQAERYGAFTYNFTVPNGSHTVTLKFAEIYFTGAGQRIFSVAINGTTVLSNFDIAASAGGANIAYDRSFPVTVTNGSVAIQFIQGSQDLPKVSAVEIQ